MVFHMKKFPLGQGVLINALTSSPDTPTTTPVLVFLHYWGGSSQTWIPVINQLRESYKCVSLDFRGWGESTGPARNDGYSIKLLAEDVEAVLGRMNVAKYTLIGLSMGAKVAQVIAANNPPSLDSMILVSPAPLSSFQLPPEMQEQQRHAYDTPESAALVVTHVLTATSPSKEVVDMLVADQLRGTEWAKRGWIDYGMTEDYANLAMKICVPTLVIAAEKDVVETPTRVREEVHEKLRGSRWEMIHESGHLSPVDCPDTVASLIKSFV